MSFPLVSIVTPCTRPLFINRAVASVLNQTYESFEILVVNDGGEDLSKQLEVFQDQRIRYFRHAKRKGRSTARNTAFYQARGKYIAYLDDDDYYYPNHLQILVEFLEDSAYKAAYTDGYQTFETNENNQNGEWDIFRKDLIYSNDFDLKRFLVDDILDTNSLMHERSCLLEVGGFDENLPVNEDWELWLRIALKYPFFHITELTHEYSTRHRGDNARLDWLGEALTTGLVIYDRYRSYSDQDVQNNQEARKRFLAEGAIQQLSYYSADRLQKSPLDQTVLLIVERSYCCGSDGDRERAKQIAEALVNRLPERPTAWLAFAKSLRFLNQFEIALRAIDQALALEITSDNISEKIHILKALQRVGEAAEQEIFFRKQYPKVQLTAEFPSLVLPKYANLTVAKELNEELGLAMTAPVLESQAVVQNFLPTALKPQKIKTVWQRDRQVREVVDWLDQLHHLHSWLVFDFFDTLVLRLYDSFDHLFFQIGKRLADLNCFKRPVSPYTYQKLRAEAEKQARSNSPNLEINLIQIYHYLESIVSDPIQAAAIEVQVQSELCYINPLIAELINYAIKIGLRVAIVADTYFTADDLSKILKYTDNLVKDKVDIILTSSDLNCTKKNGRLFQAFAECVSLNPNRLLYIGNDCFDGSISVADIHIKFFDYSLETTYISDTYNSEKLLLPISASSSYTLSFNSLRCLTKQLDGHIARNRSYYQYGSVLFGPIMACFADWCLDQLELNAFNKILIPEAANTLLSYLLREAASTRSFSLQFIAYSFSSCENCANLIHDAAIQQQICVVSWGTTDIVLANLMQLIQQTNSDIRVTGCFFLTPDLAVQWLLQGIEIQSYLDDRGTSQVLQQTIQKSGILEQITLPNSIASLSDSEGITAVLMTNILGEQRNLLQEGILTFQHLWLSISIFRESIFQDQSKQISWDQQALIILQRLIESPMQQEAHDLGNFQHPSTLPLELKQTICNDNAAQLLRSQGMLGLSNYAGAFWPQGTVALECPELLQLGFKSQHFKSVGLLGAWMRYQNNLIPYSPAESQILESYLYEQNPVSFIFFSQGYPSVRTWFLDTLFNLFKRDQKERVYVEVTGQPEESFSDRSVGIHHHVLGGEINDLLLFNLQQHLQSFQVNELCLFYFDRSYSSWQIAYILNQLTDHFPDPCMILIHCKCLDSFCRDQPNHANNRLSIQKWLKEVGQPLGFMQQAALGVSGQFFAVFDRYLQSEDMLQNLIDLQHVKLRELNLIIFPDWAQSEEILIADLACVLNILITDSSQERITLVIETRGVDKSYLDSLLSGTLMYLFLEYDLELAGLEMISTDDLSDQEYQFLRSRLHARVVLAHEGQEISLTCNSSHLVTLLPQNLNQFLRESL
jgi:glycosyltransferase involved in cell wall biosynthesis/FMN phosphatase YigB (HAD superfamily)